MATAKKKVTTTKPAKEKAPKAPAEDGMITLAKVSDELGINPAVARRKLRAAGIERAEGQGWKWKDGSKDLDKIRKVLAEPEKE